MPPILTNNLLPITALWQVSTVLSDFHCPYGVLYRKEMKSIVELTSSDQATC